jgi:hypothetical protein
MKNQTLTPEERETAIIKILDTLLDKSIPFSGVHRHEQWEKGWDENIKSGDIKPKYFDKYPITRYNGEFVIGQDEQTSLYSIIDEVYEKYLADKLLICEFGCGTGHNLVHMREKDPKKRFIGLDWTRSSNKLVTSLGMEGYHFDYFNPKWDMPEGASVITVASLEQTGKRYKKFVRYLLKKKPKVVVHIEPIPELLDKTKLIDYLSIKYMEKRRYLSGYLDFLRSLELRGFIRIHEARRSGIGSLFLDGYSVIVWSPL